MELFNSTQQDSEALKSHPLFLPVLNGMMECTLAGWGSQNTHVRLPPQPPLAFLNSETNSVDRFMLEILQAQWSNKQELEFFQKDVSNFCDGIIANLEKGQNDILQCKPEDLRDYGSVKLSASHSGLPSTNHHQRVEHMTESHKSPPPLAMGYYGNGQSHMDYRSDFNHNIPTSPLQSPSSEKKLKNPKSLPKEATDILKSWIMEHWENPYPDESTKQLLVDQTGLSRSQVVNWFINARRRLIKPMKPELEKRKAEKLQKRTRVTVAMNSNYHEESEGSDSDPDYEEPMAKKKKLNLSEVSKDLSNGNSDQVKQMISGWKHTGRKRSDDQLPEIPYCFSSSYSVDNGGSEY